MPPEVFALLAAVAIALFIAVALPKRRLPDVGARLRDLAGGRRRWLFGPPLGWSTAPPSARRRLVAELDRILELGVPLWLVARVMEDRGARVRLEEASRWASSAPALLNSHLAGTTSGEELARQLDARGLPAPAPKARSNVVARRPATPIDWWVEREELARAHSNGNGDGVGPQTNGRLVDVVDELVTKPQPGDPDLLSISILGRFEISAARTELSSELLRHKVAAYIVLYLMARTILNRKLRLTKAELADELSPGITPDKQRKRLTNRLTDMKSELPGELMARIAVAPKGGDDSIVLDLSRTSIDYDRLLALAEECAAKGGLLPPELAQEAEAVLAASEGEVLPIWDELEQLVNGARGAGGTFVRDLRQRAEDARVTIMGELAANHLARHEAGQAIPLLERALDRQPDREDLARKLRMAYLETGQHGRAAELQRAHALEA